MHVHHTISTLLFDGDAQWSRAEPWRLLALLDSLGTVRAVAETLHLSPSTVSHQLAVLETETHGRLLQRSGRWVRLTRTGVASPATAPTSVSTAATARSVFTAGVSKPGAPPRRVVSCGFSW